MVIASFYLSPCSIVFNCCLSECLASQCIFTLIEVDYYHHVLLRLITRLKGLDGWRSRCFQLHVLTFPWFSFSKKTAWVWEIFKGSIQINVVTNDFKASLEFLKSSFRTDKEASKLSTTLPLKTSLVTAQSKDGGVRCITAAFTPLTNTQKSFQRYSQGRGVGAHGKYAQRTPSSCSRPALPLNHTPATQSRQSDQRQWTGPFY